MLKRKRNPDDHVCLLLRKYVPGDEAEIIACIRDEYADTYFKQWFYDEMQIRERAEEGNTIFLVAENRDKGELAGIFILQRPKGTDGIYEMASMIFKKCYRGFGLTSPFWAFGWKLLGERKCSVVFALPVLFHSVTQELLQGRGFRAVGLILNVFDVTQVIHSYENGRNTKHSQGIQMLPVGGESAGTIYVPRKLRKYCKMIYEELGVFFRFGGEPTEPGRRNLPRNSCIHSETDDRQKSVSVEVNEVGRDCMQLIRQIMERYPLRGQYTANIFLNCSAPGAMELAEELEQEGWFFTGLKPLWGHRQYLIYHNPGEVSIWFEDYCVSSDFARILKFIAEEYKKRPLREEREG